MRFDLARAGDDEPLRALLRENPMDGAVRVTLEREPSVFLAATIEGHRHQTLVARSDDGTRLLGMGSRAVTTAFVNGVPGPVGYLGQLRIDRAQPARRRLLRGGYALLRELHRDGAVPFYLTTIVEDNRPARRLLEAGLPGLPRYRAVEPLVTLVLSTAGRARVQRGPIGRGTVADLPAIVDCLTRYGRRHQLARRWTVDDLCCPDRTRDLHPGDFLVARSAGRVTGCLAVWDQRRFKQTVVRGYAPWLSRARPLVNALGPWIGQPPLPPPGTALRSGFASHVAVDDDDPKVLIALLGAALASARARGLDYLATGFARRHPLARAVKSAFRHREYGSVLYVVGWDDDADAPPSLDGRIPHPEMATL